MVSSAYITSRFICDYISHSGNFHLIKRITELRTQNFIYEKV